MLARLSLFSLPLLLVACLPDGPPTSVSESGQPAPASTATAPKKKRAAPKPPSSATALAAADPLLAQPFEDSFERGMLGDDWRTLGGAWRVQDGKLCGQAAHNRGIWLTRRLPTNARIEFDAQSASPDGDLKVELWGDGLSGATSVSYNNATSYLAILGGWKNTLHVLARLDEHGSDRLELRIDPSDDDPRMRAVAPGQIYRFKIERTDGRTVSFWVDDLLIHKLSDPEPLVGAGHDHFGFNDWDAPVCFDNVRVTPLPG